MAVIEIVTEVLQKSLDKNYLVYMLLLFLLSIGLGIVLTLALVVVGLVLVLPGALIYAALQFTPLGIAIYAILGIIFVVALLAINAYLEALLLGLQLNLARMFLQKKKLNFNTALEAVKPRLMDAAKVMFWVSLVVVVVFIILIGLPLLTMVLSYTDPTLFLMAFGGMDPGAVIGLIIYFILVSLVVGLAYLALIPFFAIIYQIPFFEQKKGVKEYLLKGWQLARANYLSNFALIILVGIVIAVVAGIVGAFLFFINLIPSVLMMGGEAMILLGIFFMIIVFVISIILRVALSTWIFAVYSLLLMKIYLFNTGKKK